MLYQPVFKNLLSTTELEKAAEPLDRRIRDLKGDDRRAGERLLASRLLEAIQATQKDLDQATDTVAGALRYAEGGSPEMLSLSQRADESERQRQFQANWDELGHTIDLEGQS